MFDLTPLSLPDPSIRNIYAALSEIHANWLERRIKAGECHCKLFDAIAIELVSVYREAVLPYLDLIPGLVFDAGVEKGWIQLESPPPSGTVPSMSGIRSSDDWFGGHDTRDWFGRGTRIPPVAPPPPGKIKTGHHDVDEPLAKRFQLSIAGRVEFWNGKAKYRTNDQVANPERALVQKPEELHGSDSLDSHGADTEDLDDVSGRSAKRDITRDAVGPPSAGTTKAPEPDLERLIAGKLSVPIATAARYLQRSSGQVERLLREGKLERIGEGRPIKVSTASLRKRKGITGPDS